jgi:hypothetical protein
MTDVFVPDPVATPLSLQRLERIETTNAQLVAVLSEMSAKLDVLIAQGDEQVSVNRSMAQFTQLLTGQATVDSPAARPGFSDYRENEAGDGWDVMLAFPNQGADWYPATASEVQQIAEMNAKRTTRRGKRR